MARIPFDYSLDYKTLDLRKKPVLYRVGKGDSWAVTLYDKWRVQFERLSKKADAPPSE